MPDNGFEWQEQWAVNLKCTTGTDAGAEVVCKPSTVGGIQALVGLIEAVSDRLNGGQHDGQIAPIVRLEKDSYQHPESWAHLDADADDCGLDVSDGPAPDGAGTKAGIGGT